MKTILAFLLVTAALIPTLRENINAISLSVVEDKDLARTYNEMSDYGYENGCDMRELYVKVPLDNEEFAELSSLLNPDGSFSDVDYQSRIRGGWPVEIHALRVQRLAIRYVRKGDMAARDAALSAMRYWHSEMPECPNWWYNEIGVPRAMGPAYLLLLDDMSKQDVEGAIRVLGRAGLRQTGQNKIWQAGNVLLRGILQGDEPLVREARDSIASELHISGSVEGLQPDWSFHQHGPQLQFGNYGLSYAVSLSWWARAFEGTELAFSEEQKETLRNYLRNGLGKMVWNGWFDQNACGRQVFRNAQRGKALNVADALDNLGISLNDRMGGSYFPYSDFGVYHAKHWYASVRMQSAGIKGYEMTNNENTMGYFSSDGALLVRCAGDEFADISPVWNWKHIPGATTYDDGSDIRREESHSVPFYNRSKRVSGKLQGRCMVTWMELDRDSLKARKAWFFWKGGIVCLGTGISRDAEGEVITTVAQSHLRGEVTSGSNWVSHDGVTYVIMDGSQYILNNGPHRGSWHPISPVYPDEEVSADLFEMYLSHGNAPDGASYAYVVVPSGRQGRDAARRIFRRVRIIENSASRQIVRIGLRRFKVDWDSMD